MTDNNYVQWVSDNQRKAKDECSSNILPVISVMNRPPITVARKPTAL